LDTAGGTTLAAIWVDDGKSKSHGGGGGDGVGLNISNVVKYSALEAQNLVTGGNACVIFDLFLNLPDGVRGVYFHSE